MSATLQIFRAGTHTDMAGQTRTFSAADLAATARAYDPATLEAPLVVGHPATDDPAYGWVAALAAADGALEATPRQVDPAFAALVLAERFNRVSASFFLPDAPTNPVPGVYYLRHVGFLGAAAPAIKGLRKPSFNLSDETGTVTVEFSTPPALREVSFVSETQAQTAAPPAGETVDYAAQTRALEAENAALKAALDAERAKQARAEIAAFAEHLIADGRLLPRDKAGLVEFVAGLGEASIEFADGGQTVKTPARAWFDDFLKRLPVQVEYVERSAGSAPPPVGDDRHKADFAASADLRAEFGTEERYLAFQKATAAGQARILGSKV